MEIKKVTVRLEKRTADSIKETAEVLGVTQKELLETFVEDGLKKMASKVSIMKRARIEVEKKEN